MKSLIVFAILALVLAPLAMAEDTSGANWDNYSGAEWLDDARENVVGHGHSYDKYDPKFEVGLGLDLIVQERTAEQNNLTPLKTTIESKYDIANRNGGAYLVATYRAPEVWKGIKDLFGFGE